MFVVVLLLVGGKDLFKRRFLEASKGHHNHNWCATRNSLRTVKEEIKRKKREIDDWEDVEEEEENMKGDTARCATSHPNADASTD